MANNPKYNETKDHTVNARITPTAQDWLREVYKGSVADIIEQLARDEFDVARYCSLPKDSKNNLRRGFFTEVPLAAHSASMGDDGCFVEGEECIETWVHLPNKLIPKGTDDPRQCFLFSVRGDSMAPCIPSDSLVLVDPNKEAQSGDVCLVQYDDTLKVKRLRRHKETVELLSDNETYKPYKIPKQNIQHLYKVTLIITEL